MIRFIDLRGQGTEHRFAFWDTVACRFLCFDGEQAWNVWDGDCADAITTHIMPDADQTTQARALGAEPTLGRLRGLCPQWAFEADDRSHEERFWVDNCTRRSPHVGPCNGWPCTWRAEQLEAEKDLNRGRFMIWQGKPEDLPADGNLGVFDQTGKRIR